MAPLTQFVPVDTTAVTATSGTSQQVKTVACTYHGINIAETAGSTAHVRVYDHASADSGTLLDTIKLAAGESVGTWYERGKRAVLGVRIDVVSGAVEGGISTSR